MHGGHLLARASSGSAIGATPYTQYGGVVAAVAADASPGLTTGGDITVHGGHLYARGGVADIDSAYSLGDPVPMFTITGGIVDFNKVTLTLSPGAAAPAAPQDEAGTSLVRMTVSGLTTPGDYTAQGGSVPYRFTVLDANPYGALTLDGFSYFGNGLILWLPNASDETYTATNDNPLIDDRAYSIKSLVPPLIHENLNDGDDGDWVTVYPDTGKANPHTGA